MTGEIRVFLEMIKLDIYFRYDTITLFLHLPYKKSRNIIRENLHGMICGDICYNRKLRSITLLYNEESGKGLLS